MREPDPPTKPGLYWYVPALVGAEPVKVTLKDVGEQGLGVFFEDRQDYDLLSEVSGSFEPR